MEAGYDEIEEEERRTARIAKQEDAEQLKLIKREEMQEKMVRKKKRRMLDWDPRISDFLANKENLRLI